MSGFVRQRLFAGMKPRGIETYKSKSDGLPVIKAIEAATPLPYKFREDWL